MAGSIGSNSSSTPGAKRFTFPSQSSAASPSTKSSSMKSPTLSQQKQSISPQTHEKNNTKSDHRFNAQISPKIQGEHAPATLPSASRDVPGIGTSLIARRTSARRPAPIDLTSSRRTSASNKVSPSKPLSSNCLADKTGNTVSGTASNEPRPKVRGPAISFVLPTITRSRPQQKSPVKGTGSDPTVSGSEHKSSTTNSTGHNADKLQVEYEKRASQSQISWSDQNGSQGQASGKNIGSNQISNQPRLASSDLPQIQNERQIHAESANPVPFVASTNRLGPPPSTPPGVPSRTSATPSPAHEQTAIPSDPNNVTGNSNQPNAPTPAPSIKPPFIRRSTRPLGPGRMPSPPPPPTYKPRITFDLFANQSLSDPSFTLISQHKAYMRTKTSRTYLCGTDETDYAGFALEYLIDQLVDDGDDIVCVRVIDQDTETAAETDYKLKARQVQERVQEILNGPNRPAVKVVIEFAIGKVGETIDRMVNLHAPLSIVVGTRGKSIAGSSFGKTSVSQYLYQYSPVPVIIVRPAETRQKHLRKRQNDPERRKYSALAAAAGKTAAGKLKMDEFAAGGASLEASQHERDAVAKAIGLPQNLADWRPARRVSNASTNSKAARSGSREYDRERRDSNTSAISVGSSNKSLRSEDTSDDEEDGAFSRILSAKSDLELNGNRVVKSTGNHKVRGGNVDVVGLGDGDGNGDNVGESEDEDEDDEDADEDGDVADGGRFEDMPNFVPGLGRDRECKRDRRCREDENGDGDGDED